MADIAWAFNLGCDSRLRGEPIGANPLQPNTVEYRAFRQGWLDVQHCWGEETYKRGYQKLVPVIVSGSFDG